MRCRCGSWLVGCASLCAIGSLAVVAGPLRAIPSDSPVAEPAADSRVARLLGQQMRDGLRIQGGSRHRILHFTFDDGPDARTTPRLLDALDAADVKATFFFSASRFRSRERRNAQAIPLAREVLRRGHSVGSHSLDHVRMSSLRGAELQAQLDEADRQFEQVFGQPTHLFRPPFGARSEALDRSLAERGHTLVLWNLGLADWNPRPPAAFVTTWRRVLDRREREHGERGGIVLMHDTHPWVVGAFQHIHADILQTNCELLQRGEELFDIVEDLSWFYVPRGEAPPGAEAPEPVLERRWVERQAKLSERTEARCRDSILSGSL